MQEEGIFCLWTESAGEPQSSGMLRLQLRNEEPSFQQQLADLTGLDSLIIIKWYLKVSISANISIRYSANLYILISDIVALVKSVIVALEKGSAALLNNRNHGRAADSDEGILEVVINDIFKEYLWW